MTSTKAVAGLALLGIMVMAVAWFVAGCGRPKVKILCSRDQRGRLVVDLKPNWRVNALYTVTFWLEGDGTYRWVLAEGRVPVRRIVYGELPQGASQKHPRDGAPPKQVPNSGILYVGVKYQWDSTFPPAAASDTHAVRFQLTDDGGVKPLGDAGLGEGLTKPEDSEAP